MKMPGQSRPPLPPTRRAPVDSRLTTSKGSENETQNFSPHPQQQQAQRPCTQFAQKGISNSVTDGLIYHPNVNSKLHFAQSPLNSQQQQESKQTPYYPHPPQTAHYFPPSPQMPQPPYFPNFPPPYFHGINGGGGGQHVIRLSQQQQQQQSNNCNNINNNNNNCNNFPSPIQNPTESPTSFNNCSFYYSGIPWMGGGRPYNYNSGTNSAAGDDQLAPVPRLYKSELRKGSMYFGLGKSCYCKQRPGTNIRPNTFKYAKQSGRSTTCNTQSRGRTSVVYPDPESDYDDDGKPDPQVYPSKNPSKLTNNGRGNTAKKLVKDFLQPQIHNQIKNNNCTNYTSQLTNYISCNVQIPQVSLPLPRRDIYQEDGKNYSSSNNQHCNLQQSILMQRRNIDDLKRLEMIHKYYDKIERELVERGKERKPILTVHDNNRYLVPAPSPHVTNNNNNGSERENVAIKTEVVQTDQFSVENEENEYPQWTTERREKTREKDDSDKDEDTDEDDRGRRQRPRRGRERTVKPNFNMRRMPRERSRSDTALKNRHLRTRTGTGADSNRIFSGSSMSSDSWAEARDTSQVNENKYCNYESRDDDESNIFRRCVQSTSSDKDDYYSYKANNDHVNNNKELLEIFRPAEPKKESSHLIVSPPFLLTRRSGVGKTQSGPFAPNSTNHKNNNRVETSEVGILNTRKTRSMFPIKRKRRKSGKRLGHKVFIPTFSNNHNHHTTSKSNHSHRDTKAEIGNINNEHNNINQDNISAEILVKKKTSSWDRKSKEEINYAEHNYCVMPITVCVNRCCSPCCKPCCKPRCSPARITVWQTFPFNCTPSCNTTGCGPCCPPCCQPCCPPRCCSPCCRPCCPCPPILLKNRKTCCGPVGPPPCPPPNRATCCTPPPCPPRCPERCCKPRCCQDRCCRSCSPCFTERSCCSRRQSPCCRRRSCSPCSTCCPCPCPSPPPCPCPCPCPPKPCCPCPCPPPCCPPPCCPPRCCKRRRCPSPCCPCPCPNPCCPPPCCPPRCCPKPKCCPCPCPPRCSPPPCCPPRCCRPRCCPTTDRCCSPCCPSPCCCPPPRPPPCCPRPPPRRCCPPPCCQCPCPCPCPPPPCIPPPCPSPCKKKRRRRKCCCCCCPKEHVPLPQTTIVRCCPCPPSCVYTNPCACPPPPTMCCM